MTERQATPRWTIQALQRAALLIVVAIALIMLLPANQHTLQTYNLSSLEYHIALFSLALPSLLTWPVAFAGYAKLREYVYRIRGTPEEVYFNRLATGCAWLVWSLPASTFLLLILDSLANAHHNLEATAVIINTYANLALALITFSVIGSASRGLVNQAKLRLSLTNIRAIILLFLTAGVLYCYLTFRHFNLASLGSTGNPYFLPIWMMVVSVIIPYLYAWFAGLLGANEIIVFSRRTDGIIYRQALLLLAIGLVIIILSSVAVQYMSSLYPGISVTRLSYRPLLTSIFRVIGGGGFVMLAIGAARLKKIEEV